MVQTKKSKKSGSAPGPSGLRRKFTVPATVVEASTVIAQEPSPVAETSVPQSPASPSTRDAEVVMHLRYDDATIAPASQADGDSGETLAEPLAEPLVHTSDDSQNLLEETDGDGEEGGAITKVPRRKKSPPVILSEEDELKVAQWLETTGHFIYDKCNKDYKRADKTAAAFVALGKTLDPPVSGPQLRTWFYSIRSRYGRITTHKSGQGANRRLTDRERWILNVFDFLKPHIVRQRRTTTVGINQVRRNVDLSYLNLK